MCTHTHTHIHTHTHTEKTKQYTDLIHPLHLLPSLSPLTTAGVVVDGRAVERVVVGGKGRKVTGLAWGVAFPGITGDTDTLRLTRHPRAMSIAQLPQFAKLSPSSNHNNKENNKRGTCSDGSHQKPWLYLALDSPVTLKLGQGGQK